ncbi:MAG TPA: HAD family hydrolase [Verrucomicrobiales bacterium]|jgi:phosphoglycolate phosphatase-like HAD superfamily hydrolase|nr:HAD family hydrolase [Verrucomicrobiales bacterium]HIL71513.1 HAD family hydrolase [Verrucomicrobiota bacterium]
MGDNIEKDYQRVVEGAESTRFIDGSSIEIIRETVKTTKPKHVVFDFDGTLSLVREGWPEVMVPMMVEVLRETGTEETDDELRSLSYRFVMELNGKQTIYQMFRLVEEVKTRGGDPKDPQDYKQMYHNRLMDRIQQRREDLRSGKSSPESMLVPGSLKILSCLAEKGMQVYLASGTDENYVKEEVELLGLKDCFGLHVYGAVDDYKSFSKAQVIERILRENQVEGDRLLGFGDGYVEIENIKAVGGTAIAVASDEKNRSGKPDEWKRDRLIGVGADIVIPDFSESETLIEYLWS